MGPILSVWLPTGDLAWFRGTLTVEKVYRNKVGGTFCGSKDETKSRVRLTAPRKSPLHASTSKTMQRKSRRPSRPCDRPKSTTLAWKKVPTTKDSAGFQLQLKFRKTRRPAIFQKRKTKRTESQFISRTVNGAAREGVRGSLVNPTVPSLKGKLLQIGTLSSDRMPQGQNGREISAGACRDNTK